MTNSWSVEGELVVGSEDAHVAGRYFSLVTWNEDKTSTPSRSMRGLDRLFKQRKVLGYAEWHRRPRRGVNRPRPHHGRAHPLAGGKSDHGRVIGASRLRA
jgi:hypothetical protein